MIQFFMLKLHLGGGAASHQPTKFLLPIAQEGMVYKIWDSVYKIAQNKYILFVLEIRFVGWGAWAVTCTYVSPTFYKNRILLFLVFKI